jgi:hypothetical protein
MQIAMPINVLQYAMMIKATKIMLKSVLMEMT